MLLRIRRISTNCGRSIYDTFSIAREGVLWAVGVYIMRETLSTGKANAQFKLIQAWAEGFRGERHVHLLSSKDLAPAERAIVHPLGAALAYVGVPARHQHHKL